MNAHTKCWCAVGVVAAMLIAVPALAAPPKEAKVVEGVVVKVTPEEVIVDLGRESGLPDGGLVQVYRRVEVKHPVSGKVIVDRFPIGGMIMTDVGALLSITRSWSDLYRSPAVGDFVVFEPKIVAPVVQKSPEDAIEAPKPAPRDPELAAIEAAFASTLGRPLTERIAIWEKHLKYFPEGRFLDKVGAELTWLRAELTREREALEAASVPTEPDTLHTRMSSPHHITTEDAFVVNVSVVERELAEAVRVLWRRRGDPGFNTVPMARDGDYNWRVTLGPKAMEPGAVELFAEVVRTNGTLAAVSGASAVAPHQVIIEPPVHDKEETGSRSRASTIVEFVDFKAGEGEDAFLKLESDFRYKIGLGFIHAFSVGIGVFQGEGGTLREIELGQTTQRNVNFGFAELELQLHRYFGVSSRLSIGNHHQTDDGTAAGIFGVRAEMRIGEDEGTRLVLGGSLTEDVGNEAWTELTFAVLEDWPISAGVTVTNLPVGGELGVSATLGVGHQITDWLALSVRTGWNARTINHYGFTLGGGALMTW